MHDIAHTRLQRKQCPEAPRHDYHGNRYRSAPIDLVVALLLFIVPFVDRGPGNRRRTLIFNVIGVVAVLYILVMTIVGYVSE